MAIDFHTIEVPKGITPIFKDKLIVGNLPSVANNSGSAGVAVNVVFAGLSLPGSYSVQVESNQACWLSVTGKTTTGFTVTLTPTSGSVAIAAGTIDVVIIA